MQAPIKNMVITSLTSKLHRPGFRSALAAFCLIVGASGLQAHEPGENSAKHTIKVPAASAPTPLVGSPSTEGTWATLPYLMTINPIHVSLLHTGKVLIVSGSENEYGNYQIGEYFGGVWDPAAGTVTTQLIPWDVFCTGMAALPDGRFVIIGGTKNYNPFQGLPITTVFDPANEKFAQLEDMAHGRWYGSSIILSDGSLMAYSGQDESHSLNQSVEIYKPVIGWSQQYFTTIKPSLYPRMHLLPNGNVFVSGTVPKSSVFHPDTKTFDDAVATTVSNQNRKGGSSVLLPLRPESGYNAKVMILGGVTPSTKTCEIIDFGTATPAWRSTGSMIFPRIRLNAVLLPTGKVFASGGSFLDEDASTASLGAETFDPTTETWSPSGTAVYPRLYHSSALLLPDATVWTAGSNPKDVWEEHMEIYTPPYLYNADGTFATRPAITSVPAEVGYGAKLVVKTPNATDIGDVVMVRPGSSTHSFDFEQRVIGLTYSPNKAGQLNATTPPNSTIAPPGYYMIFIINKAGVPSVAQFTHLTANPTNIPPVGKITSPGGAVTIDPGQSITFAGSATDADGSVASYKWVFPGGTPPTSTAQSPGPIRFDQSGTYIVSLNTLDNMGTNDPNPPIRTITVNDLGGEELDVAITSPPAGSTVVGRKVPVTITVTGTEEDTTNTFALSVDGAQIATKAIKSTTQTLNWTTAGYAAGEHTLTATVTDYEGHTGEVTETVTFSK